MTHSRRRVVKGAGIAFVLGGLTAWGGLNIQGEHSLTLSALGYRESQAWLITHPSASALVLLGPAELRIIESLSRLMVGERSTVDLLIASHEVVSMHGVQLTNRFGIGNVFAVHSDPSVAMPNLNGRIVANSLDIAFADNVILTIRSEAPSNEVGATDIEWLIEINAHEAVVVLATSEAVLPPAITVVSLLGVPGAKRKHVQPVALLVANQSPDDEIASRYIPTSINDPVRFHIDANGISVQDLSESF